MNGENYEVPWEGRALVAAEMFAARCKELADENDYSVPPLTMLMSMLVGELRDQGFEVLQIRAALERSIDAIA